MLEGLKGRRALVTGAGNGIGAAVVRILRAHGAEVVATDIDMSALRNSIGDPDSTATIAQLDVTDEAAWSQIVSDHFADVPLDLLVHSAGVAASRHIVDTELSEFRRMIDVNLESTFLALRTAARHMADGGSIVTLSSLRGVTATEGLSAYGAAKFGVRALSRVAAIELAQRNIRVNSVCPGSIATSITDGPGFDKVDMDAYIRTIPLQRRGQPDEVAKSIAFLLSDDSAYVTGTDFLIDGGTAAGRFAPLNTKS